MLAYLTALLSMLALSPSRGDADTLLRSQLASAITTETDDPDEQRVLVRLAWFEGSYSRAVASCKVTGDAGRSLGLFQVQPRTAEDRRDACGTLNAQVRVALRYVRRSLEVCAGNTVETRLALYASGDCRRGHAAAKARWGGAMTLAIGDRVRVTASWSSFHNQAGVVVTLEPRLTVKLDGELFALPFGSGSVTKEVA